MSYAETLGPELLIQHTGQVFPLTQQPVTMGRAADNTLILADPEVSGHHATISWQADLHIFVIQDLGSTNGTFVNERLVTEPQLLRHGDVIRLGNTIIDARLETDAGSVGIAPVPPEEGGPATSTRNLLLPGIIIVLLAGITVACCVLAAVLFLGGRKGVPTITIQSPPDGARIVVGNEFILQATASGTTDITVVELSVDGALVATATSPDPAGLSTLTVSKSWVFDTLGQHTVSAIAYTAKGQSSKAESVEVAAIEAGGEVQPSATPTPEPGEPTSTPTLTATPTPTPRPGAPQIEYFRVIPQSISAGACTTLEWGKVSDATEATIEPDIGGVATPGNTTVCPRETTTYVLTATGPGGTTTASTTVTVIGALADLTIDSIDFDPEPPVQGQATNVNIVIRNAGAGAAGAFNWEWDAGPEGRFSGRLGGLNAGQTTIVTVRWTPANAHASLSTEARVDTDNEVAESDEGNNRLARGVQVVESAGPATVTVPSEASLDGYRGKDGSGSTRQDVLVGNGEIDASTGELVWRGFMSFDLSGIPAGASIDGAELQFFQAKVGGDPYGKLGNLILEHVDYGSSLDASAYNRPAMDSAVIAQEPSPGAWYILADRTIANWIEQDLAAGRPHFQLRLRFQQETDGDGDEDFCGIESANNFFGTGNAPQVIVTYSR